jgi:hypothetical protein
LVRPARKPGHLITGRLSGHVPGKDRAGANGLSRNAGWWITPAAILPIQLLYIRGLAPGGGLGAHRTIGFPEA